MFREGTDGLKGFTFETQTMATITTSNQSSNSMEGKTFAVTIFHTYTSLCSAVQNEPPPVLFSCSFTTHQTHDAFSTLTDTFEQPPAPPQFLFVSFRSLPNTPILPRSIGNIQHIEHWVGS